MTESSASQDAAPLETSIPEGGASLESILCTEELRRRPSRTPDYEKENRALVKLVSALADSPTTIFQTLADTILAITQCDSAGLSLLTRDGKTPDVCGKRFYWPAIAGMWNPHVGGGTPRNFGPCGDVLDQNRTLLFRHFERRYPYLLPVIPAAEECLLVPFYVADEAVGTIWAIMHSDRRKFDAEDDRVMASLGKFASSAYQALIHIENLKFQVSEREKAEAEVRELASGLKAKIRRLVEANVVGIVMWNLEGAITEANEAFLQMVQYAREDIVSGRVRWTELTPTEWRDRDKRAIADLKVTGIFQPFEKEYFRKDGSRVPVLLGGAFLEGSGSEGVAFVLDLTEQKRAQEKLRESETRLQAFLGNTPNLVFLKDRQGRYLYVNNEFRKAFQITEEQIRGKRDDEIFPAEQAAVFQASDRQVLEAGIPMEFEEVAQQEDGQHISIVHKFPLFDSEGEIYAVGGVVTDITERKREESARRYSEEKYRVVVETASDAVVSMDENGTILFANSATSRLFGYELTELIGEPLTVLMPDYMRTLYETESKAYLATGERRVNGEGTELRGLRKNGQEFPLEVAFGEMTSKGQRIFTGFIRDISERKQAQEALLRSEAYSAEAQRLSHTGSWHWKVSTGEVEWSQEYCAIFGFDFEKDKPSYQLFIERVHPEDRPKVEQVLWADVREKRDFDGEYRLLLPDGSVKYLHSLGKCSVDQSGDVEYIGAVVDITEHKLAEQKVRDSEERHRVVIEAASDAVVSMDESGIILLANDATSRIFGYHPAELIGKPLTVLMPIPVRQAYEAGFREYLATGQQLINWQGTELIGLRKNGQEFPVEISFGELTKDGHRIFTGFVRDISERKRGEEALRRSESYLAQAQRLARVGSWAWEIPGRHALYMSEEWYRIYGFDPKDGIPTWEQRLQRVHPEDRARWQATIDRAIAETSDYDVEFRIVIPSGSIRFIHSVGHPVLSPSGELLEFVGVAMDMTESKQAEEEREKLRQELGDLAHINRVSTMGELTASLAHEIKQPIAAAVTDAKTCLRWLGRDQPDVTEARESASRFIKDVSRASEIINRIGSLFKKDIVRRELVDVNEVIKEMINLLRSEASKHSISIYSELAEALPPIMADRVQLQQVFMNLMLNGIEAMKDMNTPGKLAVKSQQNKGEVLVLITDTGVGLRPEQTEKVFNAFFTSKSEGTGMGLPISRSIIESHGGRLWATCNPGSGATFQFTLPLEAAARLTA